MKENKHLRQMILSAIFAALSFLLIVLVRIPLVPSVPFLVFDFADVPLTLLAVVIGPGWGLLATVVAALLQGILLSADGLFGALMHCVASGAYLLTVCVVCKKSNTKGRKILSLALASVVMVFLMGIMNLALDPYFFGVPFAAVLDLLPAILLFNVIRVIIDSVCIGFLWSPFQKLYHKFF